MSLVPNICTCFLGGPPTSMADHQGLAFIGNICTSSPLHTLKTNSWHYECRWCPSCPCCKRPCSYSIVAKQPSHCYKQPCSYSLISSDSDSRRSSSQHSALPATTYWRHKQHPQHATSPQSLLPGPYRSTGSPHCCRPACWPCHTYCLSACLSKPGRSPSRSPSSSSSSNKQQLCWSSQQ